MSTAPRSEILFLYDCSYAIPNGDPFTGEQRYDDETKKILVSDVRIKRYIRDLIAQTSPGEIYVTNDPAEAPSPGKGQKTGPALIDVPADPQSQQKRSGKAVSVSGAAARAKHLAPDGMTIEAFRRLFDVRCFGGIVTGKNAAINLTGPVQFALLNPSLNRVDLRMHQNTSVFASSTEKTRGAIGTTTVVPYAVLQIHGWINAFSAQKTGLTSEDVNRMLRALWESVNTVNTRTKANQNSLLLLHIIYSDPTAKLYGLDQVLKLSIPEGKRDEQLRGTDDYSLNFSALEERVINSPIVDRIEYYAEAPDVSEQIDRIAQRHAKLAPVQWHGAR